MLLKMNKSGISSKNHLDTLSKKYGVDQKSLHSSFKLPRLRESSAMGYYSSNPPHPPLNIADIAIEMYNLDINRYLSLTEDQRSQYLMDVNAMELLHIIKELRIILNTIKIEDYILVEFLKKNNPANLFGLMCASGSLAVRRARVLDLLQDDLIKSTSASSSRLTNLIQQNVTPTERQRTGIEFILNFKTKVEMAEKSSVDIAKRVAAIENNAKNEMKLLHSKIKETMLRRNETTDTEKSFRLHFLDYEHDFILLATITEKQVERKLLKFTQNWFKRGKALLRVMRLNMTSLHDNIVQHRNDLMTKSDLCGILTTIDFEKLIIKRVELLHLLDEKNIHMSALKSVTSRASLTLLEEKQVMQNLENKIKAIGNENDNLSRAIVKLKKQVNFVERNNHRDRDVLQKFKKELNKCFAPAVFQYIEKNENTVTLMNEGKMLQRKISVLNIKFNNLKKKYGQK